MPTKANRTRSAMSNEHKRALAVGREEGRAIRRYLEALEAYRPKRGRKRSADHIETRLKQIDARLANADPLSRLHLVQERMNLRSELDSKGSGVDLAELEDGFVASAQNYAARKGVTYAAWRQAGVQPSVLRKAGIRRTRS